MKTWHRKVIRDLQENKLRSSLVVLAIAIGIFGFGSVLSTYSILTRELNTGYLATNPASATIRLERIDDDVRTELQSFDGIAGFEERRTVAVRLKSGSGVWKNAVLFVIPDFTNIRISTLKPQKGKWPPATGEILIERDAMGVASARIGDTVRVQTPDGGEVPLLLTGTVHDVGQAQARMEQLVYGYIDVASLKQIGEEPFLDQLLISVAGDKWNEEHVRSTVTRLKQHMERKGHAVKAIHVPRLGAHPHADLMGTLLIYKSSFGFFALILSGVLVINLLSAIMAGQIRQIGMMKAIGATRAQVERIYYSSVLLLSLASLAIAIPASILGGRWLSHFMSRFLNFDLQSYSISWWVYSLEFAAGIVVPLLAAAHPVYRGSRITVREAITDYGITVRQFGNKFGDRLIAGAGGLTRPVLLSIRNTFRKRGRFAFILGTLAIGGTIFIAAWNVRASLIRTVDQLFGSLRYDVSLNFAEHYPNAELTRAIRNTPEVKGLELWSSAEAFIVDRQGKSGSSPILITAPPADTSMLVFHIVQGRSLTREDTNAIVINNRLASSRPELRVGKSVRLRIGKEVTTWEVVGVAQQALAGSTAYATRDVVSEILGTSGRSKNARVVLHSKDPKSIENIKQNLEANLKRENFSVISSVSMAERRRVIDEHNSVIYTFLIVMALLLVVVGGLGLMTIMSINVLERRREIGVLRTIGATKRKLLWIILGEGAVIGAFSWLLALPLSYWISNQLGNLAAGRILQTKLEYSSDWTGAVLWLAIILLFGAAASYLPALQASRKTVRELIEYE